MSTPIRFGLSSGLDIPASPLNPRYLVIGSGKAATHFRHYFSLLNIPFRAWNRKQDPPSALRELKESVSVVLLLISDAALQPFIEEHFLGFKGDLVHFSGALEIEGATGAHPLMTFGPQLYEKSFYEDIHFACTSSVRFREIFPELANPVFEIDADQKALYHGLCVMSGNFAQILWGQTLPHFEKLGVPREALAPYWTQSLKNFLEQPHRSLTGPLARRDWQTLQRNVEALPENLRDLYLAFVHLYLPNSPLRSAHATDSRI